MNISTNKREAIKHSVDYWMRDGQRSQVELEMYQEWLQHERLHPDEEYRRNLEDRVARLMQWKYDGNQEMQRQRDKLGA